MPVPVLTVPRGLSDLTPEWLTAALAGVSDGARVTDLVAVKIGNGNVADSVRLFPTWDRVAPAPVSVVAKVPASEPVSRAAGFATRTYELEAAFYRELADTVWVHRPACFVSDFDLADQSYIVLLEDLSPAEAGDQIAGCSPDDAASVMPELAALHAPRWDDPTLLDLAWLDRPSPETAQGWGQLVPALFSGFVDRYRERLTPELLALTERLMGSLEPYLLHRPGPWSIVHCDCRVDNLLFGGPRVALVDWQTVKIGAPLSDVSYFVGSAMEPELRRQHEVDLVRIYHRQLGDLGVDLDWSRCWDDYRRYSFDGLVMAVAASMLVTQTPRSDDMFMAMASRHAQQAVDLGAEEMLPR